MAEQPKWSSSRVAQMRASQQPQSGQQPKGGTQQSRWAAPSNHVPASSSGSSWRSKASETVTPSTSTSSSSRWSKPTTTVAGNAAGPNASGSTSRWATSTATKGSDNSISTLADTLSRTSITSPPSISIHATPPQPPSSSSSGPASNLSGLRTRDPTRPLGGLNSLNRLALLASPSRGLDSTNTLSSSLLSQGSMDLTSPSVQLELRQYISDRITTKALPLLSASCEALAAMDSSTYLPSPPSQGKKDKDAAQANKREEELQQTLLLVRKLREAIVASKRQDGFAVELYELSVKLAVICSDWMQLAASLPRLVLELYPTILETKDAAESEDVVQLVGRLGIDILREGEGRERMVSLYLLQTLCLSGRATRLGQYTTSSSDSNSMLEPLHRGFREYRTLRATLSGLYGTPLQPHLEFCDAVYRALRDVDPFSFARLLQGKGEYKVDGWQRVLMLQVVPGLRGAAWVVARKTFLHLPVSRGLASLVQPEEEKADLGLKQVGEGEGYLAELLLLTTTVLPATAEEREEQKHNTGVKAVEEEVPEEWDTSSTPTATLETSIEDMRLHTFLNAEFSTTLPTRLVALKTGHAIKLR